MIRGGLSKISVGPNIYDIPVKNINVSVGITTSVGSFDESTDWKGYWKNVKVTGTFNGAEKIVTMAELSEDPTSSTITIDRADSILTNITSIEFEKNIVKYTKTNLGQYDLKVLDEIRDVILHKKGNQVLYLTDDELKETNGGSDNLVKFFTDIRQAQSNKLGGMLLKTYDSDIFNNWIKKEWVEGAGSITDRTTIDVSEGQLTMDMLNLQQKVYNMLNRIAVSGGTYKDWLETVYTAEKCLS